MLLVIDNYDSFTYNLVQFLGELGADLQVFRNDKINMEEIKALAPERVLISPGPCTPKEAGISVESTWLNAERTQFLEPMPGGGTRYHTFERMSGWQSPLVRLMYGRKMLGGFVANGIALKRRAESVRSA